MGLEHKKTLYIPNQDPRGVCLWCMPSGGFLSDGDGYLSMNGYIGDQMVEKKMRDAVKYWTGSTDGEAKWFPGYRKISDDEWEDQQARLADGKIPDEQDEAKQFLENKQR